MRSDKGTWWGWESQSLTLTQKFHEVLHMQVEGMNGGPTALILLFVDRDCGQATPYGVLFIHVQLYLGPKVLL